MSKNEFTCDCSVVHEDVVREVREKMNTGVSLERLPIFFKVLGDPTRIKMIWALDQHEMCVCDLANVLSMTKSAVSHQLAILRRAGIVKSRRDAKSVFYSLEDDHVRAILETGLEHVNE